MTNPKPEDARRETMSESTPKKLEGMTAEELLGEFGPDCLTDYGRKLRAELLRRLTPPAYPSPAEGPRHHVQVFAEELNAEIDEQVLPLVRALARLGVRTISSCQGDPGEISVQGGRYGGVCFRKGSWQELSEFCFDFLFPLFADQWDDVRVDISASATFGQQWDGWIRFRNESLPLLIERLSDPGSQPQTLCGEVVTHLIAGASWFTCARLKSECDGQHRAAGNCFTHGPYLGKPFSVPQCPKWPECAKGNQPQKEAMTTEPQSRDCGDSATGSSSAVGEQGLASQQTSKCHYCLEGIPKNKSGLHINTEDGAQYCTDDPNDGSAAAQPGQGVEVRKFYVASRASIPERSAMWRQLRTEGWAITSTWIDEAGEGETEDFGELWQRIFHEIAEADALILYAEQADFPLKGALIEAGIAIGMGKTVFVCLPGVELHGRTFRPIGSWITHSHVKQIAKIEDALAHPCAGSGPVGAESSDATKECLEKLARIELWESEREEEKVKALKAYAAHVTKGLEAAGSGERPKFSKEWLEKRAAQEEHAQSVEAGAGCASDCPCGLPPQLKEKIANWLKSNNKTHYEVRYGGFPLGMVQGLIEQSKYYGERVTQLEQELAEASAEILIQKQGVAMYKERAEAAEASLAAALKGQRATCTKIYRNIPVESFTIECSACKQHIAMGTAPVHCPACGVKFDSWPDKSIDKGASAPPADKAEQGEKA